ncbi:glycosyltransferase [Aquicoccus sp. SCR17]|nr:glycosyltransferase [Carideicomes alvinocaridis]
MNGPEDGQAEDERDALVRLRAELARERARADMAERILTRLLETGQHGGQFSRLQDLARAAIRGREQERRRMQAALSHWQTLAALLARLLAGGRIARLLPGRARLAGRRLLKAGLLDTDWYDRLNPDVGRAGLTAPAHFLRHGIAEGRPPAPVCDLTSPAAEAEATFEALSLALPAPPVSVADLLDSPAIHSPASLPEWLRAEARDLAAQGPDVSVVMPSFDRAATVGAAVASALGQSLPPREVIVADDGSRDGTAEMLEARFADAVAAGRLLVLREPRGGVCRARNAALSRARAGAVAFLDSDNLWHRDHLLWAVAGLVASGRNSVYTAYTRHDLETGTSRQEGRPWNREALLHGNYIDLNTVLLRREGPAAEERFDPELTRLVDWDYILRVTASAPACHLPVTTVEYFLDREGLGNITFSEPLEENRQRILDKMRADLR